MVKLFEIAMQALGLPPISNLPDVEPPALAEKQRTFFEFKKYLELYEKELKEVLFQIAEKVGERDENGSYTFVNDKGIGWKKEARVKMSVDTDLVKKIADERGLPLFYTKYKAEECVVQEQLKLLYSKGEDYVEVESVVDNVALEQAVLNGEITEQEFDSFVKRDVSYARKKVGW